MAKKTPRSLIKEAASTLQELMQVELAALGDAMIQQIIGRARRLPASQRIKAIGELNWPGENAYLAKLREALAEIAMEGVKSARTALPGAKRIQLEEDLDSIKLADTTIFEQLPKEVRNRITKQSQLLVGTQLGDLQKNLMFQYTDSHDTTDDFGLMESDLKEAAVEYIGGNSVRAGAAAVASKIVNESRNAFFFDDEVLEQVDAFMFVNGDPVTPICQDLNGTIFAKDDPEMFRYTPPLHWNCKSYIVPIPAGKLGKREITRLKPSTKKLEDSIQFAECCSEEFHDHCQEKN